MKDILTTVVENWNWVGFGLVLVWLYGLHVSSGAPPKKMAKIGN